MKVISIVNQKGGVAKTTTTASLAWGLARRGKKVLAIDLDPQGNLTSSMCPYTLSTLTPTVFEWLGCDSSNTVSFHNVVQRCKDADLVPANIRLSQAEMFMLQKYNRERILDKAIKALPKNAYDYVIIDCLPSLGILTINALTAANEIIIPVKLEWLCYQGASDLYNTIVTIKAEVNSNLRVKGFLLTLCDLRRNTIDIRDLYNEIAQKLDSRIFKQLIRQNVAAADAASYSQSIFDYSPDSAAAQDYMKFVDEFLEDEIYGN